MILAGHCVNINITYAYCRLKTNLSVAPLAKGVCRHAKVICIGLCNTVERYVFSFMLQHLHIQFTQLLLNHKPGRMKTLFIRVCGRICVLQELNPDPPSSSHILYLLL